MTDDPIKHVIVLMFENHSFDQMLGCFKAILPQLEGVDPANPGINKDSTGQVYKQMPCSDPMVKPDPKHELIHILNSLNNNNGEFVSEYEKEYPNTTTPQRQRIMDYFGMGDLPVLHKLASRFTICDHWFSSVPGPTWANRFFVHTGTSMGRVRMFGDGDYGPALFLGYNQDTIYDRLTEKGISWKVYYGDIPQSLMLQHQRRFANRQNYEEFDQFIEDSKAPEPAFPAFAFIEPRYGYIPCEPPQNDDHPSSSVLSAQGLLADVYNALRANEELWGKTLLVVLYDENGGFYDHVSPPKAVAPDEHNGEYDFKRLGVRVPALLISPWVEQRVLDTQFDHTSLLQYLIDKWHLNPLTKRSDAANSIREAISVNDEPRKDTPASLPKPAMKMMATGASEESPAEEPNDLQKSLVEFSKFLEAEAPTDARPKMMAAGPHSEVQLARERVRAFLRKGPTGSPQ